MVLPKKNSGQLTLQLGQGKVATSTEAKKAEGLVVAGQGHTVTAPPAVGWPWWK